MELKTRRESDSGSIENKGHLCPHPNPECSSTDSPALFF